jgi:hypothetical protein
MRQLHSQDRARRWLVLSVWLAGLLAAPATASAQTATNFCAAGQTPQFAAGFAALKAQLGTPMGDPTECEHPDPNGGGTLQHTTTGLAYYRNDTNIATFTDGWQHWALLNGVLSVWRNQSVNPPQPNAAETAFVDGTFNLRGRLDQLDQELTNMQQQASSGGLAQLDPQELSGIIDELGSLRQEFDAVGAPPTLGAFAARWDAAQDDDLNAAQELLQARQSTDPVQQAALLQMVGTQLTARDQQTEAATFVFSQVLPIAVTPT